MIMNNNNNNFPTIISSDRERELQSYEIENSRPPQEGFPAVPTNTSLNLSPDFQEFSSISETQHQQEFYNLQEQHSLLPNGERPVSSLYTRLCNLKEKLNSRQATLKSQLKQVEEQLQEVHQQFDKLS